VLHQLRPDIEPGDDLHSIGNKTILKAANLLPEVIEAFSEKKILPQKQTGTGLNCRNKDLTPTVLREIYSKFEKGMIREYLEEKEKRDRERPIVRI
jgi:S-methylmethionine-dependent homocysteine/selenocysteine methylase